MLALVAAVAGCSASTPSAHALVMGASDTPTMQVMAQIYAGALRNAGSAVSGEVHVGDDRTLLDEMDSAEVDLFPVLSGRLLSELAPQMTPVTSTGVYDDLNKALPQGVSVGDPTMVSAGKQVFIASRLAEQTHVTDLGECARLPAGLPVVVSGRPDPATTEVFAKAGCRFGPVESVGSTSAVVARVADGGAVGILTPLDVAGDDAQGPVSDIRALRVPDAAATSTAASSSPAASAAPAAGAVVAVVGPTPQDLVPVYRTAAFSRDQVKTINKVAGELTTADLASLTRRAMAGEKPADLAAGWLAEHGL